MSSTIYLLEVSVASLYTGVVLGWSEAGVAELAKGAGLKILFLVIRGFESLLPHLVLSGITRSRLRHFQLDEWIKIVTISVQMISFLSKLRYNYSIKS